MADHVLTFNTGPEHPFSSRKFSIADMTQFSSRCFLSRDVFLEFLDRLPFTYIRRRDFCTCRECRVKRVERVNRECRETDSMLFCGGLW